MNYLIITTSLLNETGLAILRIGIGILFIGHGYRKIMGGVAEWRWLGEQMGNIGVHLWPVFWGICAMLSEFVGGICLTIGLGTRVATPFMAFVMFVAITYHLKKGDSYGYISFPLSQLLIFICLLITGSGRFSLDHYWFS